MTFEKPLFQRSSWLKSKLSVSLYLFIISMNYALAAELNITASFQADVIGNNTNANQFTNTTPNGGYCINYPDLCRNNGWFSISLPMSIPSTPLVKDDPVPLRVPYSWRDLTVTHSDGTTQTVQFRIIGMGSVYILSSSVGNQSAHSQLWNGDWYTNPGAGCTRGSLAHVGGNWFRFFWFFRSDNACVKSPTYSLAGISFSENNIMYELRTPNPLQMSAGQYTGTLSYTVGRTGDIQLGNGVANDPILNLNFKLNVSHTLRVQFPVNSNLLALQPQGGWQQWINSGGNQRPNKLTINQPFRLWVSSRFKMQLQCQYPVGSDCGLQSDDNNTQIPVKTMVTLPSSLQDTSNKPVNNYLLSNNMISVFQPSNIIYDGRSSLNFEIEKSGVNQMIDSGGGRFRGNVTVIWDSEI
ncbi:hypothetical protein [Pseudomonas sp. GV071]|uniref:hypothetical protein n=1 Tax=Pseudomonas sp. GV071 TaxID=2135754 RepID=UPI000D421C9F|nr:hypothetical protein [Pseudomonas sp. GV071]PTQ69099.1 hypothetical protein C8K61_109118 [Pseudomonas sp. GV071]